MSTRLVEHRSLFSHVRIVRGRRVCGAMRPRAGVLVHGLVAGQGLLPAFQASVGSTEQCHRFPRRVVVFLSRLRTASVMGPLVSVRPPQPCTSRLRTFRVSR